MVRTGVERDLEGLPADLKGSGLAATALVLADTLDDPHTRASARAMCSKELRDTLAVLRGLMPAKPANDRLDEVNERRECRRASAA